MARHEALRQGYSMGAGGELACRLHSESSVRMEVELFNLSHCASAGEPEVQAALHAAVVRRLPLDRPPLLRTAVAHLAGDRHVLLFVGSHIVSRGPRPGGFCCLTPLLDVR